MEIRGLGFGMSLCIVLLYAMLALVVARVGDAPAYRALRHGGIAGALGLAMNMTQGLAHPLLPFVFGNTLVVLSAGWFWVGTRRFAGAQPSLWPIVVLATLMAISGFWFTFIQPSFTGRITSNATLIAMATAATAWGLLATAEGRALGRIARALGVLQLIITLLLLVRVYLHWRFSIPLHSIMEGQPLNIANYFGILLGVALFAIGLNILVVFKLVDGMLELAIRDTLTGTSNRLGLRRALEQPWPDCTGLLMMDLDGFKAINDIHGHDVGDRLLQRFVAVVRRHMHDGDLLVRMGGEEFLLLLRGTHDDPPALAEAIRRDFAMVEAGLPAASVSIGGVRLAGLTATTFRDWLKAADRALYAAKDGGRNLVQFASAAT
jgi:diguanylate cyclase (GGDEF)-like protein